MNTSIEVKKSGSMSFGQTIAAFFRYYLSGRWGWIILAVFASGAGLYFNWSGLVAAGIAPLLLSLAPCAAMCALGLCMHKTSGKSCSSAPNPEQGTGVGLPSGTIVPGTPGEPAAVSHRDAGKTRL